jgi:hypothetical protein
MTETAVNTASCNGVMVRSIEAIGSENNTVNTMMSAENTRIANRDGDL